MSNSDAFIAKFVNSEIMTKGGDAVPLDLAPIPDAEGNKYYPIFGLKPIAATNKRSGFAFSIFVDNGVLYYADSTAKAVTAFDAPTGQYKWQTVVQAGYTRSIFVDNGILYYSDQTAKLVIAFDALTGTKKWQTVAQAGWSSIIKVVIINSQNRE